MKKLLTLIIIQLSLSFSTILNVDGENYITIQSAIDDAETGDTVLVHQGLYYENLDINKTITLTSLAIYDNLDSWYEYESLTHQYEINNDNVLNTVIDASQPTDENFTSGIVVRSPEDDCITPIIMGFTIRGGMGTMVTEDTDEGEVDRMIGGGLFSYMTNAEIHHNQFTNNGDPSVENGGAVYAQTSTEDWGFDNRSSGRPRCEINEINIHDNFYRDNDAIYGNTFSNRTFTDEINLTNSLFDIYNCPESNVTGIWVDIESEAEADYSGSQGDLCAITDDVWVSPLGSDYTGDATQNSPIKTIKYALEIIAPSEDNIITIHLDEGTYSPSLTGETFSINMISNVNLIGAGEELTILDAEQTDRVITMEECENNTISDLSITSGNADGLYPHNYGGGMYLRYSNPTLNNVTISNNTANDWGGGIYLENSNPILTNMIISNNTAGSGGGMYLWLSNPTLNNTTVSNNTAGDCGGMYIENSNPTLNHVTIINNMGGRGGGMSLWLSNPTLSNVTISNNTAEYFGGGMFLLYSNPILNNVTISNNTADNGGGMYLTENSNPTLINSIIWDNSPESLYLYSDNQPVITYSDIQDGWDGEGNIGIDPLFTDPDNGDYSLQANSPCIDAANPNLWYADQDGSTADMGSTGGLFVQPNYTNYNFGEVGDIGSSKQFTLYNYRETPITISSIIFGTTSFTTDTSFPITIESFETGIINIEANNTTLGYVEDAMEIESDDLPEGISVSLIVEGAEGNVLNGNLSGAYPVATYRISGDLTVADGDTAYLDARTQFLFDGEYNFNIYGTLKALGTGSDSIIFDNYGDEKWRGFTLDNASDETEFEYVRISGAEKDDGGGMYLNYSNPILTNVSITDNKVDWYGGGIYLENSNPTLNNVIISNNSAEFSGGGMYLRGSSNPTLKNVTITDNTTEGSGGGMSLRENSNPTLNNVIISNNSAEFSGGGMYLSYSNPTLNNMTISSNTANEGGGMFLYNSNPTLTNSIIWNNSPESIYIISDEQPIIAYSDIQDGWEGEGNITDDPLFTDPENGDYTLLSNSPCINAGISYLELDGEVIVDLNESEYIGSAPDMGAYEFIFIDCLNSGDVNNDYQINVIDVLAIVCQILQYDDCDIYCNSDMDNNNSINVIDILIIIDIILNS